MDACWDKSIEFVFVPVVYPPSLPVETGFVLTARERESDVVCAQAKFLYTVDKTVLAHFDCSLTRAVRTHRERFVCLRMVQH